MPYNKEDIQALPLKGHGRSKMDCHFISLKHPDNSASFFNYLLPKITTIDEQIRTGRSYKGSDKKTRGHPFYHVSFTKSGFDKLNVKPLEYEEAFKEGMHNREQLNDIDKIDWEASFKNTIDILVIVAEDSRCNLNLIRQDIIKSLEGFGELIHTEKGTVLRRQGQAVEHFGYVDGISQPKFVDNKDLLPTTLPLVLKEEKEGGYGSYMVFRKLEQHVEKFNSQIKKLAKELNISEDLAGAQVIGRFKNGTLLTDSDTDKRKEFDYGRVEISSDKIGRRCPLHSHIRKVNPRDAKSSNTRIARRGMTYAEKGKNQSDEGVGLLFICFQNSIANQFEVLQANWANNPNFPSRKESIGIDPIIGQTKRNNSQSWNLVWNAKTPTKKEFDFSGVVSFKGGAYLYSPSLSFLTKNFPIVAEPLPPINQGLPKGFQLIVQLNRKKNESRRNTSNY